MAEGIARRLLSCDESALMYRDIALTPRIGIASFAAFSRASADSSPVALLVAAEQARWKQVIQKARIKID